MNKSLHTLHGEGRSGYLLPVGLILGAILLLAAGLLGAGAPVAETRAQAQPGRAAAVPRPDHVVIVIEENKGYGDIIGSPNAPYLNSLVAQGASLTSFYAMHHPSQPNYMEFFSGNSQGVFNDTCPPAQFTAPSLGGSLFQKYGSPPPPKSLPFKGYAQNLPPNPMTCTQGQYARKHCPWLDFTDVPANATASFAAFPQTAAGFAQLPMVSIVIPDLLNDMHSIRKKSKNPLPQEVRNGDVWLKMNLNAYVQWAMTHNSLLIVTWDEDSSSYIYPNKPVQKIDTQPPQNHIATILVGAMVTPGATSDQQYTHYDLLRTLEDMYGLPFIGGSQTASDITGIWK